MSLRSAYANVFTPIPDASGNFSGQINQNLPGDLYVGSFGQNFKVYVNGIELSGTGGGGGGGDISNWATQPANNPVNMGDFNVYNFKALNAMPITIRTGNNLNNYGGSNIFAVGQSVDTTFSNDTVIMYAFGPSAARGNSSNHVFAFGLNSAYRNAGNNLFAAGIDAATSNNGANVIAIGNGAAYQNISDNMIAIGVSAGYGNRGSDVIAIGRGAGHNNAGINSIFLGRNPNTSFSNINDHRFLVYSTDVGNPFMFGDLSSRRLCINGSSFISNYEFTVDGRTYLNGTTKIGEVITVESGIALFRGTRNVFDSNIEAGASFSLANTLTVSGLATLSGANIRNTLNVSGIVSLQSNLNVTGAVSLQSNLNVSGTGVFTGAVSLQSNLNVTGAVSLQSNLNITGTVSLQSNLNVSGLATVSGAIIQNRLLLSNPGQSSNLSGLQLVTYNPATFQIQQNSNIVMSNGNVGIGTTNPETKLQVNGAWPQFDIRSTCNDVGLRLSNGGTNGRQYTIASAATGSGVGNTGLYIYDNTANATRLLINSNGSVGIGRADPTDSLDVSGNIRNMVISSIGRALLNTRVTSNSALGTYQSVVDYIVDSNPDGFGGTYEERKYIYPVANGSTRGSVILAQQFYTKDQGSVKAGDVRLNHNVTVGENLTVNGGSTVAGTLGVTSNVTVGGSLSVTGKISGKGSFFFGMISLWYGNVADIPTFCPGWVLCDGTNGTPDLRDRFIVGAGGSYARYATGGSTTQTFNYATNCWASGACTGDAFLISPITVNKLPPYLALCYIMYLG